ncbi:MAG: polysaccharide deacetylase family protein [Bacteroidales bacterium]
MILIHVPRITPRIRYTFDYLLNSLYGLQLAYTVSAEEFTSFEGPKLVYGDKPLGDALFFASAGLLLRRTRERVEPMILPGGDLFPVDHPSAALPFDPFSAAFYMLSRYEEYQSHERDEHGRFPASQSLAFRKGFLHRPVVNAWAERLAEVLRQKYPVLQMRPPVYRFQPTVDIDSAYSYRYKGMVRTLGGFARDALQKKWSDVRLRWNVLFRQGRDPFDSFDDFRDIHQHAGLEPIYFVLFANYGQYDKNLPVNHPGFIELLRRLADEAIIGLHPSYHSATDASRLERELEALQTALNMEIIRSRQHFLRLSLPQTYRNLIHAGIREDYTMGFADQPGFRAGVCTPFPFYDLELDAPTDLMIHPITFMDGTLKDYLKLSTEEALEKIRPLIAEVKKYGGVLVSLWHNETQGGQGRWVGWPRLYREIVELAVN